VARLVLSLAREQWLKADVRWAERRLGLAGLALAVMPTVGVWRRHRRVEGRDYLGGAKGPGV
jgi:hypothetical protein